MQALMRYTVKTEHLQTHLSLLHETYTELADTQPRGITWSTHQIEGTTTFVELVEGPDLPHPLPQLPAFRRYRAGLDDRCEGEREFHELRTIGSYPHVGPDGGPHRA